MKDGQQSDIGPAKAACYLVGGCPDLFDQPPLAGVQSSQAAEQIDLFPVGGGISEYTADKKSNRIWGSSIVFL